MTSLSQSGKRRHGSSPARLTRSRACLSPPAVTLLCTGSAFASRIIHPPNSPCDPPAGGWCIHRSRGECPPRPALPKGPAIRAGGAWRDPRRWRLLRGLPHGEGGRAQCRRLSAEERVRHNLFDQHHARSRDRHRRLVRSRLSPGDARGRLARRIASLPCLPLRPFHQAHRCGRRRAVRLLHDPPARAVARPRQRPPLPIEHARAAGRLEAAVLPPRPVRAGAGRDAEWNRGAYLVEGLSHCGACHTPRNLLGAERHDQASQAP